MSTDIINRYVVTLHYDEGSLTDLNNLNSTMTLAKYATTLNDDDGQPHELGTNSFGVVSALNENDLHTQAAGLAESALHRNVEVEITCWEDYLQKIKQN